jgi:hypothetical protein
MKPTYHAITREDCDTLTDKIVEALTPVLSGHGLTVTCPRGTYSTTQVRATVVLAIKKTASEKSPAQDRFERHASDFGLDPSNYGRTFTVGGRTFTLSGLNLRARKRPIQATSDGKTWVFPRFSADQITHHGFTPAPVPHADPRRV